MDLRNSMSVSAIMGAIVNKEDGGFSSKTLLNVDVTSVMLGVSSHSALVVPENTKELARNRLSATVTAAQTKERALSLMMCTSASGSLVTTIAIIKDSRFKKEALHKAST